MKSTNLAFEYGDKMSPLETVFLSSTARDIGHLRGAIRVMLEQHSQGITQSLPQSKWHTLRPDEVASGCRQRIMEADAFVLVLGLWYGWTPPGFEKSITHLEFEWARRKWEHTTYPRVLVLVPYVGGETWRELRLMPYEYLEHPDEKTRKAHRQLLETLYHDAISGRPTGEPRWDWREVLYYNNKLDLALKFKEVMSRWNRMLLKARVAELLAQGDSAKEEVQRLIGELLQLDGDD